MPHPAAIYLRVSTERQGERVSISEQLLACEQLLTSEGDTLAVVYTDDKKYRGEAGRLVEPSAKRSDRPGFVQMLAEAGKRWRVLYAWRQDRIARGSKTTGIFLEVVEQKRVTVKLAKETFDPDMAEFKGVISGMELKIIRDRTVMGAEGRIKNGLHTGQVPRAYERVFDGNGKVINYKLKPGWKDFLAELARMFLARMPYVEMSQRLGHYPNGKRVYTSSLRYLLTNPFYFGRVAYRRVSNSMGGRPLEASGQHEPAWDEATCRAIERELARRATNARKWKRERGANKYLFNGIAHCGICGRMMHRQYTGDGRNPWKNYRCPQPWLIKMGVLSDTPHERNAISERKLLEQLEKKLTQLTPAKVEKFIRSIAPRFTTPAQHLGLQTTLADLTQQAQDLYAGLKSAQGAAATVLANELERVTKELRSAEVRWLALLGQDEPIEIERSRAEMLKLINGPPLSSLPYEEQRRIIRDRFPVLYIRDHELVGPPAPETQ